MPVTLYFSPPEKLRAIAFIYQQSLDTRKDGGIVNKVNSPGTLRKRPVRNDLGTGLNGLLPKGYVSKADSR